MVDKKEYTGRSPDSDGSFFEPDVIYDESNCMANFVIYIEVRGMPASGYKSGEVVWYLEHYNGGSMVQHDWSSGGDGPIPEEATIEHEKGHGKACIETLYPMIDAYMKQEFEGKNITTYTLEQQKKIRKKVSELIRLEEYNKASAISANEATLAAMKALPQFEPWDWASREQHKVKIPSVIPGQFEWQDATYRWKVK